MISRGVATLACGGAVVALVLTGCESSQSKSARLRAENKRSAPERGLQIGRANPDVRITASAVLNDVKAKRSAAVITLRNTSSRLQAALPLAFSVADTAGKPLFSNASPGASADLTTVPSLPAHGTLVWVNDAIVNVVGARKVVAKVGAGKAPAGSEPHLRLSKVTLADDPVDGVTAAGKVFNSSTVVQQRLVIFAVARRAGKIVAAGRSVVPSVPPGTKGTRFTVYFVGDPRGATLSLTAPPVSFGGHR
jgi:hypothetical protein